MIRGKKAPDSAPDTISLLLELARRTLLAARMRSRTRLMGLMGFHFLMDRIAAVEKDLRGLRTMGPATWILSKALLKLALTPIVLDDLKIRRAKEIDNKEVTKELSPPDIHKMDVPARPKF